MKFVYALKEIFTIFKDTRKSSFERSKRRFRFVSFTDSRIHKRNHALKN